MIRYFSHLALSALLCIAIVAHALPEDASQPIRLTADKATYSERTGVTTYSGNVIISQGTLKISASSLVVNLHGDRSIASAQATGSPASFEQVISAEKGLAKGSAQKIDYNAVSGIVTLTGNAKLTQNGASFSGNSIRYSLKAGDVEATAGGGRRVELIIPPSSTLAPEAVRP